MGHTSWKNNTSHSARKLGKVWLHSWQRHNHHLHRCGRQGHRCAALASLPLDHRRLFFTIRPTPGKTEVICPPRAFSQTCAVSFCPKAEVWICSGNGGGSCDYCNRELSWRPSIGGTRCPGNFLSKLNQTELQSHIYKPMFITTDQKKWKCTGRRILEFFLGCFLILLYCLNQAFQPPSLAC